MIEKLQQVLDYIDAANAILETCEKPAGVWAESNLQKAMEKLDVTKELVTKTLASIEQRKMYQAKGGTVWFGEI